MAAESVYGGIICSVQEFVGGEVKLRDRSPNENDEDFKFERECIHTKSAFVLKNPPLFFSSVDGSHTQTYIGTDFELGQITSSHNDSFYLKALHATDCNALVKSVGLQSFVKLMFGGGRKSEFYAWDRRLRTLGNTVMEPAEVEDWAGGETCPMAPKSFLNAHGCRRQKTDACAPQVYAGAVKVPLSETMMKLWYETLPQWHFVNSRTLMGGHR